MVFLALLVPSSFADEALMAWVAGCLPTLSSLRRLQVMATGRSDTCHPSVDFSEATLMVQFAVVRHSVRTFGQ